MAFGSKLSSTAALCCLALTACPWTDGPCRRQWPSTNVVESDAMIASLSVRIRDLRHVLQLDPDGPRVFEWDGATIATGTDSRLPARVPPQCRETCALAGAISRTAAAICVRSRELRCDEWARYQCLAASMSTEEAGERCSACSTDVDHHSAIQTNGDWPATGAGSANLAR